MRKQIAYLLLGTLTIIASSCTPIAPNKPLKLSATASGFINTATPQIITATLNSTPTATTTPTPTRTATPTPVIFSGAGDIAICGQEGDDLTAKILNDIPGIIFTTGDNNNESGTLWEFEKCFGPSWGQFKDRIRPSAGNHEYLVPDAADYFTYFGAAAGDIYKGYYSYDYGNWHIIVLNSNCGWVGGCGPSSPQITWLREDLASHNSLCSLAYWHDPRWSSGLGGSSFWLDAFWKTLYEYGVELVISSDDHDYERFAPQDTEGNLDTETGIRQFVIGTGGAGQRPFHKILENSEVQNSGTFGVLKFELYEDRYEWEFLAVEGDSFEEKGQDFCHP